MNRDEKKRVPAFQDIYKGVKDSNVKIVLVDKDGKQTIIKR
jgi:hypothetical protein